jgi:hypothetical protein
LRKIQEFDFLDKKNNQRIYNNKKVNNYYNYGINNYNTYGKQWSYTQKSGQTYHYISDIDIKHDHHSKWYNSIKQQFVWDKEFPIRLQTYDFFDRSTFSNVNQLSENIPSMHGLINEHFIRDNDFRKERKFSWNIVQNKQLNNEFNHF